MASTSAVSGLSSGLDWRKIIDQLKQLEYQKINRVKNQKTTYEKKISTWQAINKKLLALKLKAETLNTSKGFNLFTTSLSSNTQSNAEEILSVSAGEEASPGTHQIVVHQLASAQKLSSTTFASQHTVLTLSGDILISGKTVKISSTDTLLSLRDKINAVNTGTNPSGVSASIVNYGTEGYRLILLSEKEGSEGISLLNGGSTNLIGLLGFVDSSEKTVKQAILGGHKSDAFAYADKAIGGVDLLNLTSAQSGDVQITINGVVRSVSINLATDSLNDLRDSINRAFHGQFSSDSASVVSETLNGKTTYRLLIEGNEITYEDSNNILETLGVLKRAGFSEERGVTGDVANTSKGKAISPSTLIKEIDGYLDYASGDTIRLTGVDTNGNSVDTTFVIDDTTNIGNLLEAISNAYGNVTTHVMADGRIRVIDQEIGDTDLNVILTPEKTGLRFDSDHQLSDLSTIRKREIQAGREASLSVDGVVVPSSSNAVKDIIPGVTLNLKKVDLSTTVTVSINRDYPAMLGKIKELINAYNEAIEAIQNQLTYGKGEGDTQKPLFGDSTLRSIRSNLTRVILGDFLDQTNTISSLGLIGINLDVQGRLKVDDQKLTGYLETHFEDVKKLFSVGWSSTNSDLSYVYHTSDTQSGTYSVQITAIDPLQGYLKEPGDAVGNGEYLRGVSGDAKGLIVRYSGMETGTIGSVTISFGAAELLNRSILQMTDSFNGVIANKAEGIERTVKNLDQSLLRMEERIQQRMGELERRFVAMETTLSTLQSQSGWLTGQINSVSRGWWW